MDCNISQKNHRTNFFDKTDMINRIDLINLETHGIYILPKFKKNANKNSLV